MHLCVKRLRDFSGKFKVFENNIFLIKIVLNVKYIGSSKFMEAINCSSKEEQECVFDTRIIFKAMALFYLDQLNAVTAVNFCPQ